MVEQFSENSLVLAEQVHYNYTSGQTMLYGLYRVTGPKISCLDSTAGLGLGTRPAFVPNKGPGFGLGTRPRYHLV